MDNYSGRGGQKFQAPKNHQKTFRNRSFRPVSITFTLGVFFLLLCYVISDAFMMLLQQDDEYQDREYRDRNRDEDYYENKKTKKPEQTFYVTAMKKSPQNTNKFINFTFTIIGA